MPAPTDTHNLRGIALMIAAMASFAIEDVFLKRAAVALPTGEIMLLTDAVIFAFFAALTRVQIAGWSSGPSPTRWCWRGWPARRSRRWAI